MREDEYVAVVLAGIRIGGTTDPAFIGAAGVTIVCTTLAILSRPLPVFAGIVLALLVGLALAELATTAEHPLLPLAASPALAVTIAMLWRDRPMLRLGRRIVAGWLTAIALLSIAVPFVATPGYVREHAE